MKTTSSARVTRFWKRALWRVGLPLSGSALFLDSCDPTIRATVENGIINTSSSLFAAFFQAFFQVATEQTQTAMRIVETADVWLA